MNNKTQINANYRRLFQLYSTIYKIISAIICVNLRFDTLRYYHSNHPILHLIRPQNLPI